MKNSAGTQTEDFVCCCSNRVYICFGDIKLIETSMVVQLDGVSESGVFVARNFEGENKHATKKILGVLRGVLKRKPISKMTPSKVLSQDTSLTDYQESIVLKSGIYMRKVIGDSEKFFQTKCAPVCVDNFDNKSEITKKKKKKNENKMCENPSKHFENLTTSNPASNPTSNQICSQVIHHDHPLFSSKHFLGAQNQTPEKICSENTGINSCYSVDKNTETNHCYSVDKNTENKNCYSVDKNLVLEPEDKNCLKEELFLPFSNKEIETFKSALIPKNGQSKNNFDENERLSSESRTHAPISNGNENQVRKGIEFSEISKKLERNPKDFPIFYSSPLIRKHYKSPQQASPPLKNKISKQPSRKAKSPKKLRKNGSLYSLMSLSFNESDDHFITSSPLISPKAQFNEHVCNGVFTYV